MNIINMTDTVEMKKKVCWCGEPAVMKRCNVCEKTTLIDRVMIHDLSVIACLGGKVQEMCRTHGLAVKIKDREAFFK